MSPLHRKAGGDMKSQDRARCPFVSSLSPSDTLITHFS
jgi:hypothetical protein